MEEVVARIDALDRRLGVIERWVGMSPDLADVDQEIADLRRRKETALEAEDYETAAALRDKEKRLITGRAGREAEWAEATGNRPSLAAEFGRVKAELERLRALLREHGLDSGDGTA
jgi:hypothetical protein